MSHPFRIALVTMPFGPSYAPSIALTQLKFALRTLPARVEPKIFYITHDFLKDYGDTLYRRIAENRNARIGDWIFSRIAYPEIADNAKEYMDRFFGEGRVVTRAVFKKKILDKRREADAFLDALVDEYALDTYPLVGFTANWTQVTASVAMANKLKARNSDVVTVIGGANCQGRMGHVLLENTPSLDFVFSGPALRSFPRLVSSLLDGREGDCHAIKGVVSRARLASESPPPADERGDYHDLDEAIPLDYDDFLESIDDKGIADEVGSLTALFETSTGCWWGERAQCTFCGLNGLTMEYRAMRPDVAVPYLRGLIARYSSRFETFYASDRNIPKEYIEEVLPRVPLPEGTTAYYPTRIETPETIEALGKTEWRILNLGLEALSNTTLKSISKGITSFYNIKILKACVVHGVFAHWGLILGFPGEPEETYARYFEMLPTLTHLHPPIAAGTLWHQRFAPYFERADDYDLELRPMPYYEMIYPFGEEALEEMAFYFEDRDAEHVAAMRQWQRRLYKERILPWRQAWFGEGSARPELILVRREEGTFVRDSRPISISDAGRSVEHALSPEAARVLASLEEPSSANRVADQLGMSLSRIEEEISSLRDRHLLFQDGIRFVSLVLDREPIREVKRPA